MSPTKSTFFEEKILVALDTHAKKMNTPSIILGGGVHGKACWLIAYKLNLILTKKMEFFRIFLNTNVCALEEHFR